MKVISRIFVLKEPQTNTKENGIEGKERRKIKDTARSGEGI
jgi:hypothetical protein